MKVTTLKTEGDYSITGNTSLLVDSLTLSGSFNLKGLYENLHFLFSSFFINGSFRLHVQIAESLVLEEVEYAEAITFYDNAIFTINNGAKVLINKLPTISSTPVVAWQFSAYPSSSPSSPSSLTIASGATVTINDGAYLQINVPFYMSGGIFHYYLFFLFINNLICRIEYETQFSACGGSFII